MSGEASQFCTGRQPDSRAGGLSHHQAALPPPTDRREHDVARLLPPLLPPLLLYTGASVLLLPRDGREVRPDRVQREESVEGGGCCPSLPLRCLSTRYLQILLFAAATTT